MAGKLSPICSSCWPIPSKYLSRSKSMINSNENKSCYKDIAIGEIQRNTVWNLHRWRQNMKKKNIYYSFIWVTISLNFTSYVIE
jgi:hypothetical protein